MTGSERAFAGGGRGGGSRSLLSSPRKTELRSAGVINYLQLSSLPHSARKKKLSGQNENGWERKEMKRLKAEKGGAEGMLGSSFARERVPGPGEHGIF